MANGCSFPYLTTALVVAALLSGIGAWQSQCGHFPKTTFARTNITGVIESPNYPNQYPNNTNCQWKITARWGYVVRLYVVDMDLEDEDSCSYDSIYIFDGGFKWFHGRLLAKFCGQSYQNRNIYSTGRSMYIEFTSDDSIAKRGFQLRYKAVLPSQANYNTTTTSTTAAPTTAATTTPTTAMTTTPTTAMTTTPWSASSHQCSFGATQSLRASLGLTRSLYSPNYPIGYGSNLNCGWKIEASWGYVVRLYVARVDLEESSDCGFDSISVFDGVSPSYSLLLAKLCNDSDRGHTFYSTGRYMYVKFRSDASVSGSGFHLDYKAVLRSQANHDTTTTTTPRRFGGHCDLSMTDPLRASPGVTRSIYLPNYPNEYPSNRNCRWKIKADRGYVVRLHVALVDLEESANCGLDSISVFDGEWPGQSQHLANLCHDSDQGRTFYSTGRYMFVSFKSDESQSGRGFELDYEAVVYPRDGHDTTTTTMSWWHQTTAADRYRSTYRHHNGALIGGLSAGLVVGLALLFAIVLLCRRRNKKLRNTPHRVMRRARATSSPAPDSGMMYQNNAMFVVPNVRYTSPSTGFSNLAYFPYGDSPPAYSTLLPITSLQPGGGAGPSNAMAAPPGKATEPLRTTAAQPGGPSELPNTTAAQPGGPIGPPNAMVAQPDEPAGPPNTIAAQPGSPAGPSNNMAAQKGGPAIPSDTMTTQPSTDVLSAWSASASPPPTYSDSIMESYPPVTPSSK